MESTDWDQLWTIWLSWDMTAVTHSWLCLCAPANCSNWSRMQVHKSPPTFLSYTTPMLRSLLWLAIANCIRFKTLILAYKAKNRPAPPTSKHLLHLTLHHVLPAPPRLTWLVYAHYLSRHEEDSSQVWHRGGGTNTPWIWELLSHWVSSDGD